jgi:hypothetical protein
MRGYQQLSLGRINVISDEPIPSSFGVPAITVSILRHTQKLLVERISKSRYNTVAADSRETFYPGGSSDYYTLLSPEMRNVLRHHKQTPNGVMVNFNVS